MSNTTSKSTKAAALARVQALVAGTKKHFPNGSFTLGNVAYTTATLVQALESLANAIVALNAAQASARDAKSTLTTTPAEQRALESPGQAGEGHRTTTGCAATALYE